MGDATISSDDESDQLEHSQSTQRTADADDASARMPAVVVKVCYCASSLACDRVRCQTRAPPRPATKRRRKRSESATSASTRHVPTVIIDAPPTVPVDTIATTLVTADTRAAVSADGASTSAVLVLLPAPPAASARALAALRGAPTTPLPPATAGTRTRAPRGSRGNVSTSISFQQAVENGSAAALAIVGARTRAPRNAQTPLKLRDALPSRRASAAAEQRTATAVSTTAVPERATDARDDTVAALSISLPDLRASSVQDDASESTALPQPVLPPSPLLAAVDAPTQITTSLPVMDSIVDETSRTRTPPPTSVVAPVGTALTATAANATSTSSSSTTTIVMPMAVVMAHGRGVRTCGASVVRDRSAVSGAAGRAGSGSVAVSRARRGRGAARGRAGSGAVVAARAVAAADVELSLPSASLDTHKASVLLDEADVDNEVAQYSSASMEMPVVVDSGRDTPAVPPVDVSAALMATMAAQPAVGVVESREQISIPQQSVPEVTPVSTTVEQAQSVDNDDALRTAPSSPVVRVHATDEVAELNALFADPAVATQTSNVSVPSDDVASVPASTASASPGVVTVETAPVPVTMLSLPSSLSGASGELNERDRSGEQDESQGKRRRFGAARSQRSAGDHRSVCVRRCQQRQRCGT
jgi:hypothetical protein